MSSSRFLDACETSLIRATGLTTSFFLLVLRRQRRWLYPCILLSCFGYLFATYSSPRYGGSQFKPVRSTYDWSQRDFHHPLTSTRSLPTGKPRSLHNIQQAKSWTWLPQSSTQKHRQAVVKSIFLKSWNNYKEFAWMRDELTPVTGGAKDTFGGWAATAVDALDTLWIMDLKTEFYDAVHAIVKLDWSKVDGTACNMFETTIRHLGGLLSAYDLSKIPALLEKAVELGDMLYNAFDTPNHMPPFWLDYEKAKQGQLIPDDHQPSASATSLSLEFTRLAQLTGNDKYYDAIARVTDLLYEYQNRTKLPGMWPTFFDLRNGVFTEDNSFTLGALSDSMYEYVFKMNLLLSRTEPKYEQMYRTASDVIIRHLLFKPMTPNNLDILFSGTVRVGDRIELDPEGQHLACFAGGMFAMGGKLFDIPEHVDIGARLTKGCIWAYDSFITGVMPEIFGLIKCETGVNCVWNESSWRETMVQDESTDNLPKGFLNARDPRYILRPEALESVFILYRITDDEEYRTAAWRTFQHIMGATEAEYGNSAIDDVTKSHPERLDSQESFWLAETLKYAYLIFSSPNLISLDEFVLNTEAHPLAIPRG